MSSAFFCLLTSCRQLFPVGSFLSSDRNPLCPTKLPCSRWQRPDAHLNGAGNHGCGASQRRHRMCGTVLRHRPRQQQQCNTPMASSCRRRRRHRSLLAPTVDTISSARFKAREWLFWACPPTVRARLSLASAAAATRRSRLCWWRCWRKSPSLARAGERGPPPQRTLAPALLRLKSPAQTVLVRPQTVRTPALLASSWACHLVSFELPSDHPLITL